MLVRPPITDFEFEAYYELRWRILRKPWNQPQGSEKDEMEGEAIHLAAWNHVGRIIGTGRLHRVVEAHGQIRYMAVEPVERSHGVGQAILRELEIRAMESGIEEIKLDSRQGAVPFYQRNGYQVLRPSHTLFGTILHFEMWKRLR